MLATWGENDDCNPSALIKRGLQLAQELEQEGEQPPKRPEPPASAEILWPVDSSTPCTVDPIAVVSPQAFPGIQTPTKIQLPIPPAPNPAPETLSAKTETWSEVWWQRGLHKFQQGDYDGARQNFAKALQEEPNFVPAHNGLGMVFYIYAEYAAAVAAFQTALSLQSFAYIHCNLGSALYQLGDIVGAIAAYRHACHTNPYQASAYYGLGVALFKLRRYGESITAYEQATQIQPGHADSYGGLGRLLYETGDRPGAIVAYRKAMQLNPSYTKLYLTLQLEAV